MLICIVSPSLKLYKKSEKKKNVRHTFNNGFINLERIFTQIFTLLMNK